MEEKYQLFWKKIAKDMEGIWRGLVQIALCNTGLSEHGNLTVVLEDDSIEEIVKGHKIIKEIARKKKPPPLIVSPQYIESSLDSFPLEFLNIQSDYSNIYSKKDVFNGLQFDKKLVRLEMERELKSKVLLIKMAVLDNYDNHKVLKELITVSIRAIEPVLKGLLFLKDEPIMRERKELIYKADELVDFDIGFLLTAVEFASGNLKIEKNELKKFFDLYTKQLRDLSDYVDELDET